MTAAAYSFLSHPPTMGKEVHLLQIPDATHRPLARNLAALNIPVSNRNGGQFTNPWIPAQAGMD